MSIRARSIAEGSFNINFIITSSPVAPTRLGVFAFYKIGQNTGVQRHVTCPQDLLGQPKQYDAGPV